MDTDDALMAASPLRSTGDVGRVAAAFFLVVVGIVLTEFLIAGQRRFLLSPLGWAEILGAATASIGTFALLWPTARTFHGNSTAA